MRAAIQIFGASRPKSGSDFGERRHDVPFPTLRRSATQATHLGPALGSCRSIFLPRFWRSRLVVRQPRHPNTGLRIRFEEVSPKHPCGEVDGYLWAVLLD